VAKWWEVAGEGRGGSEGEKKVKQKCQVGDDEER